MLHPIDLSSPLRADGPALELTAHEMAVYLKTELPYVFGFEHRETAIDEVRLTDPEGPFSADRAFHLFAAARGDTWQISALMSEAQENSRDVAHMAAIPVPVVLGDVDAVGVA